MQRHLAALVAASLAGFQAAHASGPSAARTGFVADTGAAPVAHAVVPAPVPAILLLNEGFDGVGLLPARGWVMQNLSNPVGGSGWFQGNSGLTGTQFDAFDGLANSYVAADFYAGGGTISNWLMTPQVPFGAGATLTFYTRKSSPDTYPDRLEVRVSTQGASTDAGGTATSVGDFTTLALSINPTLVTDVYPQAWTQYTITGLPHSGSGRLAFRYFVTDGGSSGANSFYVGIDRVTYARGPAEFQIGGTVSGLAGSGLVLQLNGGNDLPIGADGPFQFPAYVSQGGSYAVTVTGQPGGLSQTCTVANGSGTAGGTVTDVQVACTTNAFSVGGVVVGLAGSGLSLQLNGSQDLAVAADGGFMFPGSLVDGSVYDVTVATQPTGLSQTCSVDAASGTVGGSNVSDVAVACSTNAFSIGGVVSGLAGSGLTLQLNGSQDLAVSADGSFTFPASLVDGSAYGVTVATQPTALSQTCSVSAGSGIVGGSNVNNVAVACSTNAFSIGGNVAGLAGSGLTLQLNGSQDLAVSADGRFTFPAGLADGSPYAVTVATPPTNLNQSCSVSSGSGTLAGADVTGVAVTCTTLTYFIGGDVAGLAGAGLTLHLSTGQEVAVAANGAFVFASPVDDGTAFMVSVATQPTGPNQVCTVAGGGGTVAGADVTSVHIACATAAHPVSGSVVGLDGSGLVLQLNGSDDLPVPADGPFAFSQSVAEGEAFDVSVSTQPTGGSSDACRVYGGTGTMGTSPIADVLVICDFIFVDAFDIF